MEKNHLTNDQHLKLYYWMLLTRVLDETMVTMWKQGRGVGGAFSQRGHEAVSVGAAYALPPDDVIAPMHRDLGAYLLRRMTARHIFVICSGAPMAYRADATPRRRSAPAAAIVNCINKVKISATIRCWRI